MGKMIELRGRSLDYPRVTVSYVRDSDACGEINTAPSLGVLNFSI